MATLTVFADTTDGYVLSSNGTYSTARAGSGLSADTTSDLRVGQNTGFSVWQSYLQFDSSPLGATASISAAILSLWGTTDNSGTNFTIEARLHDWGTGLTTADWVAGASLAGLTLLATFATAGFTTGAYNAFTDVAMPANINKTGSTRMMLSSSRQRGSNQPTGLELVDVESADTAGTTNDPKLVITYSTAVNVSETPTPIAVTVTPVAPALSATVAFVPTPVALAVTPVAPGVAAVASIVPTPVPVTVSPVAPTVAAQQVAATTPTPLSVTVSPVAPSVAGAATSTPAPVAVTVSPVAPSFAAVAAIVPAPVAVTLTPVAPAVVGRQSIAETPTPLAVTISPVAPVAGSSPDVRPGPLTVTVTPVAPAVGQAQTVTPSPLAVTLTVVGPATRSTAAPPLTPVQLAVGVVAPAFARSGSAAPAPIVLTLTIPLVAAGMPVLLEGTAGGRGGAWGRLTIRGAGMPLLAYVYDGANPSTMLGLLDGARELSIFDPVGDVGSGTFAIPVDDPKARLVARGNLVRVAVNGREVFGFWIRRVQEKVLSIGGRSGLWRIASGPSVEDLMRRAITATPDRTLYGYLPAILWDLIEEAATSGRLVTAAMTRTYTDAEDSDGVEWSDFAQYEIPAHTTTALDIWRQAVAIGVDLRMSPALALSAYEGDRGQRLEEYVVLRPGVDLAADIELPADDSDWMNVVTVKGKDDVLATVYGDHSDPRRGRAEGYVEFPSSADGAVLRRVGLSAIAASEARSQAFRLDLAPRRFLPYLDFDKGDWIGVPRSGRTEAHRVRAITLAQREGGGYTVTLDLNAVTVDNMTRLAQRIDSEWLRVWGIQRQLAARVTALE